MIRWTETFSWREVLAAKGIPPKTQAIIRAIHTKTTVQFMANGFISERLSVTSGIQQGCPLAPLLFIIAVDLLYDTIETDEALAGVALGPRGTLAELKAAGYADDTAIYIAHRSIQKDAIRAVQRFSSVSAQCAKVGGDKPGKEGQRGGEQ
jgi:hypothetical protein